MHKKIILIMVLFMFLPVVFAVQTTINIKTLPNHDVQIKILDPFPKEGESNRLEYFEENSGDSGEVSIISYASKPQIDIAVILKKNGERVSVNDKFLHEFERKTTGGIINLEVKETPVVVETVEETNESSEEETIVAEEEDVEASQAETNESVTEEESIAGIEGERKSGMTGFIVDKSKAIATSKITYYIIGGIFIIGILFFMIMIMRGKLNSPKEIKIRKIGDVKDVKDDKIMDIEKRIEDAKNEIDEIKNRKKRLLEAREKFKRDQEELKRLEEE